MPQERQSQHLIVEQLKIELSDHVSLKELNALAEYLADQCDNMRLTLIREELREAGLIDQLYYQLVPCDDSIIECHGRTCTIDGVAITVETDVYEVTLPNLVTGVFGHNVKSVSDPKLTQDFTRVALDDFIGFKSQYASPGPIYTIIGANKMLIRNLPTMGMKFLNIYALLASPKTNCNWKSTDYYPVPSIYKLKLLVKKDFLSTRGVATQQQQKPNDKDQES